jgi:hypothetical protein
VSAELERLVERRASQDKPDPAEQNALWKASVQRHNARRREENRQAWAAFHQLQAERHRAILEALIAEHEAKARKLQEGMV